MDAPAELPRGNAEPPWLGWEAAPPLRSASADEAAGLLMEMAGASLSDAAEGSAAGGGERDGEAAENPSHAGHRVGGASKADAAMQVPHHNPSDRKPPDAIRLLFPLQCMRRRKTLLNISPA